MSGYRLSLFATGFYVGCSLGASAQPKELVSQGGLALPAPEIETLGCDEIQDLMYLYSASGYRSPGEIPAHPDDAALFDYENALGEQHYELCHLGANDFSNPSEIFGKGFN